jgi:chromate transporter
MMNSNLKDIFRLFARLGITAFGGPAAHIAMMHHEVVAKRQWMNDQEFINLVGATNLIPGPNSTELAIHIGHKKAGWNGLLAAGTFFILPAVLITGVIAWLYKAYGTLPEVEPFIFGIKPAIIAIILMAVYPMAKTTVKSAELALLGIAALVLAIAGFSEIAVMFGLGLLYLLYRYIRNSGNMYSILPLFFFGTSISNTSLFFTFLKIGSILYGSGYVLFAFIDTELVATGVLSREVLIDAIAVGQFTPGPVFSSVTFIGYQVNGFWGAVVSTVGIFLPSFVFVVLLNKMMHLLDKATWFKFFLDGVNVASVAVIAAVCWQMGNDIFVDWRAVIIASASFILLISYPKINSAFVVVFGSIAGYLLSLL